MLNFADYANRVRCGAPLPPVPEEDRRALAYFLDLEVEREENILQGGGTLYGKLKAYTITNVRRLRAQVNVLVVPW